MPDYADGYNLDGVSGTPDDSLAGAVSFTPLRIGLPAGLDPSSTLTFSYAASAPWLIAKSTTDFGTHVEYAYVRPDAANQHLRIWTKNASDARNKQTVAADGDFVAAGTPYRLSDLGYSGNEGNLELFIEAIAGSSSRAADRIEVELSATAGGSTYSLAQGVRTTLVSLDADADSDNDGLERDHYEDHIEAYPPFDGALITISDDPAEFAPYHVSVPTWVNVTGTTVAFDFLPSKVKLWTASGTSFEVEPGTQYALAPPPAGAPATPWLPFAGGALHLKVQGLTALRDLDSAGAAITATLRVVTGAVNFEQQDEVKVSAGNVWKAVGTWQAGSPAYVEATADVPRRETANSLAALAKAITNNSEDAKLLAYQQVGIISKGTRIDVTRLLRKLESNIRKDVVHAAQSAKHANFGGLVVDAATFTESQINIVFKDLPGPIELVDCQGMVLLELSRGVIKQLNPGEFTKMHLRPAAFWGPAGGAYLSPQPAGPPKPGDWMQFGNFGDYMLKHPNGDWSSEHTIMIGADSYYGWNDGTFSKLGMRSFLQQKYNEGLPLQQRITLAQIPQPDNKGFVNVAKLGQAIFELRMKQGPSSP